MKHCEKVRKLGDGTILETIQVFSIYALAGEGESAERLLERLRAVKEKQYARYIFLAHASVSLRKNQQTLDWLDKAYEQRDPLLVFLKAEPRFDPLSQLSRFRSLVRLVGLPADSEISKAV